MLTIKDNRNIDKTMKRILFIISAVAALVFTSCKKEVEDITSHYQIYARSNTDHVTLGNGSNIVAEFYPKTTDTGVDTDITFSFRVDPSRASQFTEAGAILLPETNYLFTKSVVSIPAMYMYDVSGEEICQLTVYHSDKLEPETVYFVPVVIEGLIGSGYAFYDKDEVFFITVKTTKAGTGSGTVGDPYKVRTVEDLYGMKELTVAGQTTYFKLENDLDLSGIANWTPLNTDGSDPFTIDFDGNGKTIRNLTCIDKPGASFFGAISGNIHDLIFDGCIVKAMEGAGEMAIVANLLGYKSGDVQTTVKNIVVKNSKVGDPEGINSSYQAFVAVCAEYATFENVYVEKSNSMTIDPGSSSPAGGLVAVVDRPCRFVRCGNAADLPGLQSKGIAGIVGQIYSGSISECWNTGNLTGNESVAGIAGTIGTIKSGSDTETHTISNCYNKGTITCSGQKSGGIAGILYNSSDILNCYDTGDIVSTPNQKGQIDGRGYGGIAGHVCNGGGWDYNVEDGGGTNRIISCHCFCEHIISTATKDDRPTSAPIIGFAHLYNTYKGCYRAPWFGNNDPSQTALVLAYDIAAIPVDQEDCSATNPLQAFDKGKSTAAGTIVGGHTSPYHGKMTDKATVSALVQSLGGDIAWDSAIWDFSGDTPTLKNNPER